MTRTTKKPKVSNPAAVDAWIAARPEAQRPALERLRAQIRAAAPDAIETIAYGVPTYYAGASHLLGLAAFTHHITLGVGRETLDAVRDALEGYDVLKDTIRFTPERPLPATLVKKLVKTRVALHVDGKND